MEVDGYRNFLLGAAKGGYIYPVMQERIYVASELPVFFERAKNELEQLLSSIQTGRNPIIISEREQIDYELHILGHGKTLTNKQGKLTGWSGDMLCSDGGIDLAESQAKEIKSNEFYLRFTSDLPRAIHHALLLKGDTKLEGVLEEISKEVLTEMETKGNLYDVRIYHKLMELALENGFIPTPLLRAQYYGPMELCPEKLEEKDKEEFVKKLVEQTKQNFNDAQRTIEFDLHRAEIEAEAEALADALVHRKELLFAQQDNRGRYIAENRFGMVQRLAHFYETVLRKVDKGERVLAVTSSGCVDVLPSYFRYLGHKAMITLEIPKTKSRGQVLVVKLGKYDGRTLYLNDPHLFEERIQDQNSKIAERRRYSLDESVREGKGIVETPLVAETIERDISGKEVHKRTTVTIEEILAYEGQPILVLGDGGQGKSILSIAIAERITKEFSEGNKRIVIFKHGEDINRLSDVKYIKREILDFSIGLPASLLKEYEFIYVIDGLEALSEVYKTEVVKISSELAKEDRNKVIITSRYLGFSPYEDANPEFRTIQIDSQGIANNVELFLEGRLDEERIKEFKRYIAVYDEPIKGAFQTLFFLLELYKHPKEVKDFLTRDKTLAVIQEGRSLTEFQIRDAIDDLMLGRYVSTKPRIYDRQKGNPEAIKKIVLATKRHMDEMAFKELTGQEPHHL